MNLRALFLGAIAYVAAVKADTIDYDSVQPFAEPVPITDSEKSAIKYKPQLHISSGCYPYPAVQADGAVSGGLGLPIFPDGKCKGSELGSQIYSRSNWYKGKWAIMYAWYFPRGSQLSYDYWYAHRHYWLYGIVWTDTPNPDNSTILGVSMSAGIGYGETAPVKPKFVVNDTTVKFETHKSFWGGGMAIRLTTKPGDTQDLITWEQLTDEARTALIETDFNGKWFSKRVVMPLKDDAFWERLKKAYPF